MTMIFHIFPKTCFQHSKYRKYKIFLYRFLQSFRSRHVCLLSLYLNTHGVLSWSYLPLPVFRWEFHWSSDPSVMCLTFFWQFSQQFQWSSVPEMGPPSEVVIESFQVLIRTHSPGWTIWTMNSNSGAGNSVFCFWENRRKTTIPAYSSKEKHRWLWTAELHQPHSCKVVQITFHKRIYLGFSRQGLNSFFYSNI